METVEKVLESHEQQSVPGLGAVESLWGESDKEYFGYASEEDRKSKRGLEDWELVEKISLSQKPVPYWFIAVVVVVALVGVSLSFPFWGVRKGVDQPWLDWGFAIALVYIAGGGYVVHKMVQMHGTVEMGRLDSDPLNQIHDDEEHTPK